MGDLIWAPGEFITNLKYMGIGMLGVFIIIGIIIASTYATNVIINKAAKKRADRED